MNLATEIGDKTFDEVKQEAQKIWEQQLQKIVIEDSKLADKTNFYTAMYHVSIAPNLYQDVGRTLSWYGFKNSPNNRF